MARYSYDFYHYQKEFSPDPFAIRICKRCDTQKRPFMHLVAFIYSDAIENPLHSVSIESGESFSVDSFAYSIWGKGVENNVYISDYEYNRLIEFILQVILGQ